MRFGIVALLAASLPVAVAQATQQANHPDAVPGSVDGRVTDSQTGEPVSGANVHLYPQIVQGGVSSSPTTQTRADGSFRFDAVTPASYFVVADQSAYTSSGPGLTIRVHSGQQISNLRLQLHPLATITGKVVEDDGTPAAGVLVTAYSIYDWRGHVQLRAGPIATTGEDGSYWLQKIAPGKYFVDANPSLMKAPERKRELKGQDQEYDLVRTFYPKSLNPDGAASLDVTPGQIAAGTDIHLQRAASHRVQGRIEQLEPKADAAVSLAPHGSLPLAGLSVSVKPAKDGSFAIDRVVAGSYTLWLIATSSSPQAGRGRGQKLMARQNIDVAAEDVTGIVLNVSPPISLAGRVTIDGGPVQSTAQMRLAFIPGGEAMFGSYVSVNVNSDGSFSVPGLDPGEYKVTVQNAPVGSYVQSVQYNRQDVTTSGIDLSEGGAGEVDVVLRMGASEVDGTVEGIEGPASGIGILVPDQVAPDGSGTLLANVTAAGNFTIRNVPPGHYSVFVIAHWTGLWQNGAFLREVQREGASVDVQENSRVQIQVPFIPDEDIARTASRLGLSVE